MMPKVLHLMIFFGLWSSISLCAYGNPLEFDAKKNGVELYGPYIKYNFLKKPFSLGQHEFGPKSLQLEYRETPGDGEKEATKALHAIWPTFVLQEGEISLFSLKNDKIDDFEVSWDNTNAGGGITTFAFPDSSDRWLEELQKGVHFCIDQTLDYGVINVCSDKLKLVDGKFVPFRVSSEVKIKVNGHKSPTNAQINIGKEDKVFELHVKFKSGMKFYIKDRVRRIDIDNVSLNLNDKRIGISGKKSERRDTESSLRDKFVHYLSERNYYRDNLLPDMDWPQELTDVDMEFAPTSQGAGLQLYGISIEELPEKEFKVKLDDAAPIATYSREVVLKGYKSPEEKVFGVRKGALKLHPDKERFLWTFQTPEKGQYNKDHIVYSQTKGEKYFFSRRIYRGHQRSISASAALSSSTDLSVVPGYNLNAEYWPETLYNRHPLVFQRWGFALNKFQTLSDFSVPGSTTRISVDWTNIDIMARFNKGVRPVQSTFGAALRYFVPAMNLSTNVDMTPHLLGMGVFWHTAPQKVVDDIFNIVPFFRYPKWMEISLYLYPMTMTPNFSLGLAFSYHARGRLYFSQNWYFDASFNVTSVAFRRGTAGGVKAFDLTVSTAHGTVGFGYSF